MRRRAVAGLGLAVLVQACAAGSPVAQSPVLPLLVPWAWNAEGTGVSVSLWAFGVTADEAPPVVGSNGVVRAFEWQAPRRGVPVTARPLEVVTSTTGGALTFSVDGGVSNRVEVVSPLRVVASPPAFPQLVPWLEGSDAVLVVAEAFGSGRLVTPAGDPLPDGSFSCEQGGAGLREIAMRCVVRRRGPLEADGYGGASVRAVVDAPGGPRLTAAVPLP